MFDLVKRLLRDRSGAPAPGVFGAVETATRSGISGWAANGARGEASIAIQIRVGDRLVYEGAAESARPDIDRIYGLSGAMGFSLSADQWRGDDEDFGRLELRSRSGASGTWQPVLPPRETHRARSPARSRAGLDLSLQPLRLDLVRKGLPAGRILEGLSVLDIGCNERGLYRKAAELGARQVAAIGVEDGDPKDATARDMASPWDLPNGAFDLIYLSVLHLVPEPKRYLRKLRDHLSRDGMLILECELGRSKGVHRNTWSTVSVDGVLRRYPSSQVLKDDLLDGYAVRAAGASDGAPLHAFRKHIFHCRPFRTIVVLISASGGAGKSAIAKLLRARGFRTFSLDLLLKRIIQSDDYDWSGLAPALRPFRDAPTLRRLDQVGRLIAGENLAGEFATVVMQDLSLETPLLFIEGEILIHEQVRSALERNLRDRGVTVWGMTPSFKSAPQN